MNTCDAYALGMEKQCPGIEEHCARGEHCTATTASCAAEASGLDHPSNCCDCKTPLHGLKEEEPL